MIDIDHQLAGKYGSSPPFLNSSKPSYGDSNSDIRGAYLVLQLHDELLYEVQERDLPCVAGIYSPTGDGECPTVVFEVPSQDEGWVFPGNPCQLDTPSLILNLL